MRSVELSQASIEQIARRVAELLGHTNQRPKIDPGAVYTITEGAALVRLTEQTLRKYLRLGLVKGRRRAGGHWRILGSELLRVAQ